MCAKFTQNGIFRRVNGMHKKRHFSALSVACVWFMFGKTSLASMKFGM